MFANYARHHETGEPMPQALVEKIKQVSHLQPGLPARPNTSPRRSSTWRGTRCRRRPASRGRRLRGVALQRFRVDLPQVPPRYRTTYFAHIWSSGYAAGYYAYLWTEVLDHDAFAWFSENGGMTRANGQRFRDMILSRGGTEDAASLSGLPRSGPGSRAAARGARADRRQARVAPRQPARMLPPGGTPMPEHDLQTVAFPTLDEAQIAELARCTAAVSRHYAAGETLIDVGDRDFKFFVVTSGEIEILDVSGDAPKTVAVHGPGEFTGDVSHLDRQSGDRPRRRADRREVYAISAEGLREMLNQCPDLGDVVLQAFIARRQLLRESGTFTGLRVIGSRYSQDTFRIRDFLAKNRVLFTWLDLEAIRRCSELLKHFGVCRGRHAGRRLRAAAAAAQSRRTSSSRRRSASAGRSSRRCTISPSSARDRPGSRPPSTARRRD